MRRAIGVGAAVIVVVLLAWWLRRADRADRATPAQTARPGREAPPEPIRPVRPPDVPGARADARPGAPGPAIDAGTKEREPGTPAIRPLAETAAEAGPRLRVAAGPCAHGEVAASASITFRYTLVIAGGVARVDDVAVVISDLSDADVEDCVVGALEEVTWESPGAADARLGVQDVIVLSDLTPP